MARAIFYTHQTSGTCAGVCACDRTHQMEKTALPILDNILEYYPISKIIPKKTVPGKVP